MPKLPFSIGLHFVKLGASELLDICVNRKFFKDRKAVSSIIFLKARSRLVHSAELLLKVDPEDVLTELELFSPDVGRGGC